MKDMRLQSMLAAVELLDQQIRHHQYGIPPEPRTVLINSEWVEGETLPPKAGAMVEKLPEKAQDNGFF